MREAESNPNDAVRPAVAREFLCRHGEASLSRRHCQMGQPETDASRKKLALRQLVLLDYMSGKDTSATSSNIRPLAELIFLHPANTNKPTYSMVTVPGPLPSFARMAALSPDLAPEDLLPALARNIVTNGYEASGNEALQQTEYLRLLIRYIAQARELQEMATKEGKSLSPLAIAKKPARS